MADWVLLETKKNVRFSECSGPELDALSKTINNSNAINGVIASLQLIYNHIVDANKPKFEAWAKTVRTEDIESLYFGLYKACYGDANFLGRTCDTKEHGGCAKTSFIKTDINDMVKFDNDKIDSSKDSAVVEVMGGEFYKFDPSNSATENPVQNWVPEGYTVTSENDWYKVTAE